MTVITQDFADDDPEVLFAAEGIMHRIILTRADSGYAVLKIEGIKNQDRWTSTASLTPGERYALARALDPEAYEEVS